MLHLRLLFKHLNKFGVVINIAKCIFGSNEIRYRRNNINLFSIAPMASQVEAIRNYKHFATIRDLKLLISKTAGWVHPNNQATYKACVSRYGTPLAIMIDQGRQFESALFKMLRKQRSLHRHFSNCPARTTMQFLRDLDTSSTELVFGTTLQLAEEWFANVNTDECVPHIF